MKRLQTVSTVVFAASLLANSAFAGDVADFETRLRLAYGDYRMALFATNANKPEEAGRAVAAFSTAWDNLAPGGKAPPQYIDDPRFSSTLESVSKIAATAADEVAAGKLPKAHETLEGIREEIAGLHDRNGIIGFSDRMNAYHAQMERVIGMAGPDPLAMREQATVLEYLVTSIASHPPTDADGSFSELLKGVEGSVAKLRAAAESGDAAAMKAAAGGLKGPYSKLFLKFG